MGWIQSLSRLPAAKIIFSLIIVAGLVGIIVFGSKFFRSDLPDEAHSTMFICSETGKTFLHENQEGDTIPLYSPFSKKNTAYIAERCYWNADGTIKEKPTYVLILSFVEGHENENTFCPDCGRLVVGHNPRPNPNNLKPPPTREEWEHNRGQ